MDTQDSQAAQIWKNGVWQIQRCQQQKLHFFTNPFSPYQKSPKSVQQIFIRKIDGKSFQIGKIGQQFELKVGKTNLCTKFFPSGTYYYTCRQCCCQTKIGTTMCFCQECWVPEKHIGHYFQQKLSTGSAYCDCGRQTRIKPSSFCLTHCQPGKRTIQISQQQRKQYIQYFQWLFLCYLYLRINGSSLQSYHELEVKLNKRIEQLCVASLFYIRLTTEIMTKRVNIHQTQRTILEWLICLNQHSQKMLFAMIGDDEFKYLVIKAIAKLNSENAQTEDIRLVKSQFYENDSIFFVFADRGEYIESQNKRYIQIAQNSEAGIQLLSSYLKHQRTKLPNNESYMKFLFSTFTQKSYELLMKKKELAKMILNMLLTEREKVFHIFQQEFLNMIPLLAVSLFSIADRDVNKLSEIQGILKNQSENMWQSLKTFLKELLKYSKQYILKAIITKSSWFVVLLRVMIISQEKSEYINALWQNFKKTDPNLTEDLIQTLSSIYHLTSLISSSFIFLSSFIPKVKNAQLEEQRQKWIKSFMYENKQVPRNDILKMREKGQFKFPQAGKKFKEICSYNQSKDAFQYNSQQKYPNYLLRFTTMKNVKDLKNINVKRFRYSDEFDFDGPKYISETLEAIFSEKSFVTNICTTWNDKLAAALSDQQLKTHWKNYDLSLYYTFTLVYANVLSNKRNQLIGEQIRKIKQSQSELQKYSMFCIVKSRLFELLQVEETTKKSDKVQEEQQKIERKQINQQTQISPTTSKVVDLLLKKKIFQMKRLKILEKFKKSAQKFTNNNIMPEPSHLHQDEQQCIICHEGGKKDNSLMNIGMMQRNTTVAYSIYGNDDKTQVNIKCCFHLIHYSCFLTINKSGFQFNCPLCSKRSNIYIPNTFDKKSLRRSSNLINAIEVTKNKNHDFHFLVEYFVRHLVGNYALNSIILKFCSENQKSNNKKVDQMILKMAEMLANNMNVCQKQQFEEDMNKIIESMDSIKKEHIKKVQKFFMKTLVHKLLGKQSIFSLKQLNELEEMIIPEEFEKIRQNLQQLIGQKIDQLNQKNQNIVQKQRIGIKINHPPQHFQNFDSYYKKTCQLCEKENTKLVCLLCSNSLCQQCLSGAVHGAEHNSNYFVLMIESKKISIRQTGGKVNGNHNIYFDAFMTSFEDSQKYNSEEIYELNKSKIQKLITSYLVRN